MLALQNGWMQCAKVLNQWVVNKDRDLRERTPGLDSRAGPSFAQDFSDPNSSPSPRRRLHVKQSIDTALNMLKSPDCRPSRNAHTPTPPASPMKPFGEYTFNPVDADATPVDLNSRRPSLPQLPQLPSDPSRYRKTSTSASSSETTKLRRPRSAGTGAERGDRKSTQEAVYPIYGRGGSGRKLGQKYSLMNIFKKGQAGDDSSAQTPEVLSSRDSPAIPGSTVTLPLPTTLNHFNNTSNPNLSESPGVPSTAPPRSGFLHRGSDASTRGGRFTPQMQPTNLPTIPRKPSGTFQSQTPPRANLPLAVELHLALQQQQRAGTLTDESDFKSASPLARFSPALHNRNRSASASSNPMDVQIPPDEGSPPAFNVGSDPSEAKPTPSPSGRPGILRAHNRTSSGPGTPPNLRTLRFDSSSSIPSSERKGKDSPRLTQPPLRSQSSSSSISKLHVHANHDSVDASSTGESDHTALAGAMPLGDDGEEEIYGEPIPIEPDAPNVPSVLLQRQRGLSFASSSESSLSPIMTDDNPNAPVLNSDFPFSIHRPPVVSRESDDHVQELLSSPSRLGVPALIDSRGRGDSLSSDSTSDSRSNMHMSSSGTSMTVSTPGLSGALFLPLDSGKPVEMDRTISSGDEDGLQPTQAVTSSTNGKRRTHTPIDIDIANISSHAQAEALVQRARQDVLELAGAQELSPAASSGRTPLSARLAAYGESLALERKLREQKLSEETYWNDKVHDPMPPSAAVPGSPNPPLPMASTSASNTIPMASPVSPFLPSGNVTPILPRQRTKSREGVERQLSLEHRSPSQPRRARNDPRRPSTAEGGMWCCSAQHFFN